MTGAKLLGMHETVTSPTEYRSHHISWWCRRRGAELCGRRVGFQVLGGNPRPRPQLRVGIVCGVAPGDAGGKPSGAWVSKPPA